MHGVGGGGEGLQEGIGAADRRDAWEGGLQVVEESCIADRAAQQAPTRGIAISPTCMYQVSRYVETAVVMAANHDYKQQAFPSYVNARRPRWRCRQSECLRYHAAAQVQSCQRTRRTKRHKATSMQSIRTSRYTCQAHIMYLYTYEYVVYKSDEYTYIYIYIKYTCSHVRQHQNQQGRRFAGDKPPSH